MAFNYPNPEMGHFA